MKINPDSPDFQGRIDSTSGTAKPGGEAFGDKLATKSQSTSSAANAQPLSAAVEGLKKADLADPATANAAIQHAVSEIMNREFGGMCAPDRQRVASWLTSDPLMREAVLKRLTSLAS